MAASTPAMVLGQVEAELRRRGYKFQEDEDLIFHTDNRLLTGIGERTTDCTVVTTNALVHFENGAKTVTEVSGGPTPIGYVHLGIIPGGHRSGFPADCFHGPLAVPVVISFHSFHLR